MGDTAMPKGKVEQGVLVLLALMVAVSSALDTDVIASYQDDPVEQAKAELEKVDSNRDGFADLAEIAAYMRMHIMEPEETEALTHQQVLDQAWEHGEEYLSELDSNKDGYLGLDEITAHYAEMKAEDEESGTAEAE